VDENFVQNIDSSIHDPKDFYSYHSPRYTGLFGLYKTDDCSTTYNYNIKQNVTYCATIVERRACILILNCIVAYIDDTYGIDSEKEKRAGIGRDWDLEPLELGELYVSNLLAEDLGIVDGLEVVVRYE
jgi:hypothetical protein